TQYDVYGNATHILDAAGNETVLFYDSRSRLKTKDIKGGGVLHSHQELTYDDLDRTTLDVTTDALFGSPAQQTKYTYYPVGGAHAGLVETITNPLGHVTHFYYEPKTNRLQRKVEEKVEQPDGGTK